VRRILLDGDHPFRLSRKESRQNPETRAHFEDRLFSSDFGHVDLASSDAVVYEEMLPEAPARANADPPQLRGRIAALHSFGKVGGG